MMNVGISEKLIFIAMGLLCIGLAGTIDFKSNLEADEQYCFMVGIYKQTNGRDGWPDYENRYERSCR